MRCRGNPWLATAEIFLLDRYLNIRVCIRRGYFLPDATRSGRFVAGAPGKDLAEEYARIDEAARPWPAVRKAARVVNETEDVSAHGDLKNEKELVEMQLDASAASDISAWSQEKTFLVKQGSWLKSQLQKLRTKSLKGMIHLQIQIRLLLPAVRSMRSRSTRSSMVMGLSNILLKNASSTARPRCCTVRERSNPCYFVEGDAMIIICIWWMEHIFTGLDAQAAFVERS